MIEIIGTHDHTRLSYRWLIWRHAAQ